MFNKWSSTTLWDRSTEGWEERVFLLCLSGEIGLGQTKRAGPVTEQL